MSITVIAAEQPGFLHDDLRHSHLAIADQATLGARYKAPIALLFMKCHVFVEGYGSPSPKYYLHYLVVPIHYSGDIKDKIERALYLKLKFINRNFGSNIINLITLKPKQMRTSCLIEIETTDATLDLGVQFAAIAAKIFGEMNHGCLSLKQILGNYHVPVIKG